MTKSGKHPHDHRGSTEQVGDESVALSEIESGLSAIYGQEREDLKVVARGGSRLTRWLLRIVAVLFFSCIVVFLGYFGYRYFFATPSSGKPLAMEIIVPPELSSGTMATMTLRYANTTNAPLTNVEIDVNLPEGFWLKNARPEATNIENFVWNLGTISARSDGELVIEGVWWADVPSTTGVQALASYKPANFNAQFHDIATATVATPTSTLAMTIDEVPAVHVGDMVAYVFHVKNIGTENIVAPTVDVTIPKGFFVQTSSPAIVPGGALTYTLADLLPDTEFLITVSGVYASDVIDAQTISGVASVGQARKSPQATAETVTVVEGNVLSLAMVGNGVEGTIMADPGSLLRVALRLENTGDTAIADATALLDFTAEDNLPIDWSTAVLDGGKITARGITFDAKALGTLAPGDHTTVNLAFPLKTNLTAVSSTFSIAFTATHAGLTVQAPSLVVVLNSDVTLTSTLRYYDNDGSPLGSGPLPPTVGESTHYRALWSFSGGLHGVKDITVSATLPDDVAWDDFATADGGTVSYDANTRIVRWAIASVADDAGMVTARLSLSLTPTDLDVGLIKTILGKTVFTAKDEKTGAIIERSADAITTECLGDIYVRDRDTVQK